MKSNSSCSATCGVIISLLLLWIPFCSSHDSNNKSGLKSKWHNWRHRHRSDHLEKPINTIQNIVRKSLDKRKLNSERVPYSAESFQSPPQIIAGRGYPVEVHHVTTDDGYIIELHRIPSKKAGAKAVLLQHGVFESSGTWLVNPSERALPFLLADRGYDVWLGNARGNRFSRTHVSLNPKEAKYWDFGWDEIGKYDIPAVINYILDKTGLTKLIYTSHSMGGAVFFIAMITHPELNDKIEMMVGLAPLSSFANAGTRLRYLFPFYRPLLAIANLLTPGVPFVDNENFNGAFRKLLRIFCEQTYAQVRFCERIINFFIIKLDYPNLDDNLWPVIDTNFMMGTSKRVAVQFAQSWLTGQFGQKFQTYNFGRRGNLQRYGSPRPIQYDLSKVTAPTYIFYGSMDNIVAPKDVEWLLPQLGNLKFSKKIEGYTHMDFVWGSDVNEKLNNDVIALLPSP